MQPKLSNDTRASAFTYFLAGLGTGIAVTLLVAPASGADIRAYLDRGVQSGEDWVRTKAEAAETYVQTQAADVERRVRDVAAAATRA